MYREWKYILKEKKKKIEIGERFKDIKVGDLEHRRTVTLNKYQSQELIENFWGKKKYMRDISYHFVVYVIPFFCFPFRF